jgi:hypothetical protein
MTDIEAKALALPDRLRIIPDANGMMYDDYDDVMEAADLIEAQAAENERLREHLISALDTLKDAEICNDECSPCNEARAALEQSK